MEAPALNRRRTTVGVVLVALVALALRLFALGSRVFHWDEGRVGYWILQYAETGEWTYRAVLHGPFLFHVNEATFGFFGPTNFVARFVVAAVGAALPLAALLYRDRLGRVETLALAAILAINPVVLYYSRFMRNDVLVAAFAFVAVGFFVRLIDTGRARHLYAGVGSLALAFTTKEVVLVYLAVWVGALGLLLDHRLLATRFRDVGWRETVRGYANLGSRRLVRWWPHLAIAVVEFVAVITLFYAPRPDLYRVVGDPATIPAVIQAATVGAWKEMWGMWVAGGHEHSYVDFFVTDVKRLGATSLPLVAFGVGGFVVDRYAQRRPRDLISFGFYWAAAVFFVYPAITDISAPWGLVHVVVPLALPAAAGVQVLVDRGADALAANDTVSLVLVAVVLVAASLQAGLVAYETSYADPQTDANPLVQYGQPAGHLHPTLADVGRIAATNEGTDVLFYGNHFYVPDDADRTGGKWTNRLPLPWYLARSNATVDSTISPPRVTGRAPVVIALAEDYSEIEGRLEGYEARTYELTSVNTETVFFIDRTALNASA
ncbi:MAG: flippase activity-associated protein Agl23 [Halanaeroarchaeum sp.]